MRPPKDQNTFKHFRFIDDPCNFNNDHNENKKMKTKNTCNNLSKFAKKSYFDKVTSKGFVGNKAFWNIVKPFLTNKGFHTNENITIKHKDRL